MKNMLKENATVDSEFLDNLYICPTLLHCIKKLSKGHEGHKIYITIAA